VNSLSTSVFDLPDRLAAKADPALIAADEEHFAAIAESLEHSISELSDRLEATRRAPGGTGQAAMDRDMEVHRLTAGAVALREGRAWRSCDLRLNSDRQGEFAERDRQPPVRRLLDGELVVSPPNVLDEGMAANDHPGVTVLLEAAHRSQPRFQPAVVALDAVVGVLVGTMPGRWQQRLQHHVGARKSAIGSEP